MGIQCTKDRQMLSNFPSRQYCRQCYSDHLVLQVRKTDLVVLGGISVSFVAVFLVEGGGDIDSSSSIM